MKELIPLLERLAEQLGTTSKYLLSVFVKQAFISGISDIIQYALIVLGVIVWWKFKAKLFKEDRDFYDFDDWTVLRAFWVISGVFLAIMVLVAFFCFPDTIKAFFNSECWAIEKLFGTLKSMK